MSTPLSSNPELKAKLERLKAEIRKASVLTVSRAPQRKSAAEDRPRRRWLVEGMALVAKVTVVIALPFVILVGGSVWLYSRVGMPTWLALVLGVAATATVLTWYMLRVTRTLNARIRFKFVITRVAIPFVVTYCAYSLVYLSRVNAKSENVRQYYTAVHPLLRVAITTATVFDRELVVTDMARVPEDYDRMGLPRLENSLHFTQRDGYVHAVDLRTMRRAEWRNLVMRGYFALMGFRTLRHVGTADHLHVSLPLR